MLGFPSTLFTTSCSQPEDFVKTSTFFSLAASSRFDSASPAPVSAALRRNSLRLELENKLMESVLAMSFRMLATRKLFEHAILGPSQLSHARFRGVVRSPDPPLQIFEVPAQSAILLFIAAG